ncbi:MAG: PH domain-containing protein [Candidatus Dadabacteria bacterium]|nr:MAG: PH domain-containing protein [Candidatus Dadabacteria bacterium]
MIISDELLHGCFEVKLYPSAKALYDKGIANTAAPLFIRRRAIRSLFPLIFLDIFLFGVAYGITFARDLILARFGISLPTIHPGLWVWIPPVLCLLEIFRKYYNDLYIFDRYRIIHKKGLLSLKYSKPVLRYADIRAISISQSIIGRLLNYGRIGLSSAAEDVDEIVVHGVIGPKEFAALVDAMRTETEKQMLKQEMNTSLKQPSASALAE